jgi:hypothetical protein
MTSLTEEKSSSASMNDPTEVLSPCLRLLIEILLNEATTKKSEDSRCPNPNPRNDCAACPQRLR